MARYLPKTLSKTLTYITWHAPSEFGLFWDPEGSMPWKDLYWALQEDQSLRFVREAHIREILYLGLELPFRLEEGRLRLRDDLAEIEYPLDENPPERLFHACPVKQFGVIRNRGLCPSRRHYVALCSEKDLAMRIARRRYSDPRLFEIMANEAACSGIGIRRAGQGFYLVERVPAEYVVFPRLREQELAKLADGGRKKEKKPSEAPGILTPGSFGIDVRQLEGIYGKKEVGGKAGGKGKSRRSWKQEARRDRQKRTP